jgi:hypothetical protein
VRIYLKDNKTPEKFEEVSAAFDKFAKYNLPLSYPNNKMKLRD